MPFIMIENESFDPREVGFFCAIGVIEPSDFIPRLIEQFRFTHFPLPKKIVFNMLHFHYKEIFNSKKGG